MVSVSYSFVSKKDPVETLELLETEDDSPTSAPAAVTFKIIRGSLTANNKFYWSFGERPPFNFNKCYPLNAETSRLVQARSGNDGDDNDDEKHSSPAVADYMHPVVWGIAEVASSNMDNVDIGSQYLGILPMGETVSFAKAHLNLEDESIVVHRPEAFSAYNSFSKIDPDSALASSCEHSDLALACFPGIITGHGLYYRLKRCDCYGGAENVTLAVTSASSKVALAMALYVKNDPDKTFENMKIIGYTSKSNVEFCQKTGLYDHVLGYDEMLPKSKKYVMIDIAGRGDIYTNNEKEPEIDILKLLVIGNSSSTEDKKNTAALFSYYATIKMAFAMVGLPSWIHSWMHPTQEFYLIWEDMVEMKKEYGHEKLEEMKKEYSLEFCKFAKKYMNVREATTEREVGQAFTDILQGLVPPSETIVLDVAKAVAHRK